MDKIILFGLVIFVYAQMAECWCCGCPGGYPCAATKGCNIFCCNCAGSCQKDRICKINETSNGNGGMRYLIGKRKRSADDEKERKIFSSWDIILGK